MLLEDLPPTEVASLPPAPTPRADAGKSRRDGVPNPASLTGTVDTAEGGGHPGSGLYLNALAAFLHQAGRFPRGE